MKTHYVLIDYENVHVQSLALLEEPAFQVRLFLGPSHKRLPVDLVLAMHRFGGGGDGGRAIVARCRPNVGC